MSVLARRLQVLSQGSEQMVGMLGDGPGREALIEAVTSFQIGLRAALDGRVEVSASRQSIAREGLGMGASLLDLMRPSTPARVSSLLEPPDSFVALGVGMAHARLGRGISPDVLGALLDHGWNGWGFQRAAMEPHRIRGPVRLGAAEHERDVWVGAGRALWFLYAGNPEPIIERLQLAHVEPRRWLWRGLGIASAFAGGATEASRGVLARACEDGSYEQGAAQGTEAGR